MAMKNALRRMTGAAALLGLSTTSAFAGACGAVPCDLGVSAKPALAADHGPVTVQSHTPYDYFDSIDFQRAPHVSITRVHGLPPTVELADAPVGFTKGCHPESTLYCRQSDNRSLTTTSSYKPITGSPTVSPTVVSPPVVTAAPSRVTRPMVMQRPTRTLPVQPSRIVAVGQGFDATKFAPRVYGDPYRITPGIAHVPTSIVDRDPYRAQAVLDAGPGGITPALLGVPVRPHVPPRLPVGYPAPVVSAMTVQGQQALNSVTVTHGRYATGGPVFYPRPPVMVRPVPPAYSAPTVCRTPMRPAPVATGRYAGQAHMVHPVPMTGRYGPSTCGSKPVARGRY